MGHSVSDSISCIYSVADYHQHAIAWAIFDGARTVTPGQLQHGEHLAGALLSKI